MKKMTAILLLFIVFVFFPSCAGSADGSADGTTETTQAEESIEGQAKIIDIPLTEDCDYVFGVDETNAALLQQINEYITEIKSDGTLDKLIGVYFTDEEKPVIVPVEEKEDGQQLVVATDADRPAFEQKTEDGFSGLDMALAKGLADRLGRELEIKDVRADTLGQMLADGEADVIVSSLTADAELGDNVRFSEPYYSAAQVLIVTAEDTAYDACADADEILELLAALTTDDKIGVQKYALGQYFVIGDEDLGYEGFQAECVPYPNCKYAVENLLSGDVGCVIADKSAAQPVLDAFK